MCSVNYEFISKVLASIMPLALVQYKPNGDYCIITIDALI
jgi:hypothetical protein